jgi:hypothetical protein
MKQVNSKFVMRNMIKDFYQLLRAWKRIPIERVEKSACEVPTEAKELIPCYGLEELDLACLSVHSLIVKAHPRELLVLHSQIANYIRIQSEETVLSEDLLFGTDSSVDEDDTQSGIFCKYADHCADLVFKAPMKYIVAKEAKVADQSLVRIVQALINLDLVCHYAHDMGRRMLILLKHAEPEAVDVSIQTSAIGIQDETLKRAIKRLGCHYMSKFPVDTLTRPLLERKEIGLMKRFSVAYSNFYYDDLNRTREIKEWHLTLNPFFCSLWFTMWHKMAMTADAGKNQHQAELMGIKQICPVCHTQFEDNLLAVLDGCGEYMCLGCVKNMVQDPPRKRQV